MVYTQASRTLTVKYGNFTLNDTNGIILNAKDVAYQHTRGGIDGGGAPGFFSIEFTLRLLSPTGVQATDDASFSSLCRAVETNLHISRQRLLVQLNGNTLHDWNPTAGTVSAFHIKPSITKKGLPFDNGRAQRYLFTVTCDRPADLSGQNWRQASNTQQTYTINGRRVCVLTGTWTASSSGTALANYQAQGDTYFSSVLPTAVTGGEWAKTDDTANNDDENAVCNVTRTYWEVVNGLRDYNIRVDYNSANAKTVTISGTYTKCAAHASAQAAYNDATLGIKATVQNILTAVGGNYNAWDQPDTKQEVPTLTDEVFRFSRTYIEIIYPQSPSGTDDANVVNYSLTVAASYSFEPQTFTSAIMVNRLRFASATYSVNIDKTKNTDPNGLWTSSLRGHCISAIQSKMNASSVFVQSEDVSVDLDRNRLNARLLCVLVNSNVLSLRMSERIVRSPGKRFVPRADGLPHSYFAFEQPPEKRLLRVAVAEYSSNGQAPTFWAPGDDANGYSFVNTGKTAEQDLDDQEKDGWTQSIPGWSCRSFDENHTPITRGDQGQMSTIAVTHAEEWLYIGNVETPVSKGVA